jgi:hypothetical protein
MAFERIRQPSQLALSPRVVIGEHIAESDLRQRRDGSDHGLMIHPPGWRFCR